MKKVLILIFSIMALIGCKSFIPAGASEPAPSKINARVLVYLSEEFVNYQYSFIAVFGRYDYNFKDSVTKEVPQFFSDLFTVADITYKPVTNMDNYDFVIVPEFVSANLFTDRIFGNDLLIYIKAAFTSKNILKNLAFEGAGRSSDDKVIAETPDLGRKAFTAALKDLKKNILEKRNLLESTPQ